MIRAYRRLPHPHRLRHAARLPDLARLRPGDDAGTGRGAGRPAGALDGHHGTDAGRHAVGLGGRAPARSTLGPYSSIRRRLLVVPANVARFADDWSLDLDEVRLWVCLRELTAHAVLSRPHVAQRMRELLVRAVQGMAEDTAGLVENLQGIDFTQPEALQGLLGDPTSLMSMEASPARPARGGRPAGGGGGAASGTSNTSWTRLRCACSGGGGRSPRRGGVGRSTGRARTGLPS